jgi:hypothetical protein
MNPIFEHRSYVLRRQVFALTGKFRFYDPMENLVMFSEQKMFRLRGDIRAYSDESKQTEVLMIQARQIIDFSAAYDVIDSATGAKVGVLRRKAGARSCVMNGRCSTRRTSRSVSCSRTAWGWPCCAVSYWAACSRRTMT